MRAYLMACDLLATDIFCAGADSLVAFAATYVIIAGVFAVVGSGGSDLCSYLFQVFELAGTGGVG